MIADDARNPAINRGARAADGDAGDRVPASGVAGAKCGPVDSEDDGMMVGIAPHKCRDIR